MRVKGVVKMKLKPVIKKELAPETYEEMVEQKPKKKKANKLPSDEYRPMFEPIRILVRDYPSSKDVTKRVKQYVEMSVKRFNDDEALPCVFLQMYQESDFYTGYLKGKSVHFPLESLYEILEGLGDLDEECDKRNITY